MIGSPSHCDIAAPLVKPAIPNTTKAIKEQMRHAHLNITAPRVAVKTV
jgi:hypothetical protein